MVKKRYLDTSRLRDFEKRNLLQIYVELFAFSKFFDKKNALFVKKVHFLQLTARFANQVSIRRKYNRKRT